MRDRRPNLWFESSHQPLKSTISPMIGPFKSLRLKVFLKYLKEFTIPTNHSDRTEPCDTESVGVSEFGIRLSDVLPHHHRTHRSSLTSLAHEFRIYFVNPATATKRRPPKIAHAQQSSIASQPSSSNSEPLTSFLTCFVLNLSERQNT